MVQYEVNEKRHLAFIQHAIRCLITITAIIGAALPAQGDTLKKASHSASPSPMATPVMVEERENTSARNATTREYLRTYEIANQGERKTHREVRKLIEKSDGLNYDAALVGDQAGSPQWLPTESDFVADPAGGWKIEKGPSKVHVAADLKARSFVTYEVPFRNGLLNPKTADSPSKISRVRMSLAAGRAVFTDGSGRTLFTNEPTRCLGVAKGNHIVFQGAFMFGDLELVYEHGVLHQNVIVRKPALLASILGQNGDPKKINMEIHTDVEDISDPVIQRQVKTSGIGDTVEYVIRSKSKKADAKEHPVVHFGNSLAWGINEPTKQIAMRKRVLAAQGRQNAFTHIEAIPLATVTASTQDEGYVLDYAIVTRAGQSETRESWLAGTTYHILSPYTIIGGNWLIIEGGAVIKVEQNAYIQLENTALVTQATARNYIIFTSANDGSVGEPITNGTGPASAFLKFVQNDQNSDPEYWTKIQYCKFNAATVGLSFYSENESPKIYENPIHDCIFRGGNIGIDTNGSNEGVSLNVHNCLFINQSQNAIKAGSSYDLTVINCTFEGNANANAEIDCSNGGGRVITIKNNLVHSFYPSVGIKAVGGTGSVINNNRIYYAGYAANPVYQVPSQQNNADYDNFSGNLFQPCTNGDYYVHPDRFSEIENCGATATEIPTLSKKTIKKPALLNGTESSIPLVALDTDMNDIGYHYDRVDATYESTIYYPYGLTVNAPGTVIAGSDNGVLRFNGGTVKLDGSAPNPIIITTTDATGDKITDPLWSSRPDGLELMDPLADLEANYVIFEHLYVGILSNEASPIHASNCVFNASGYGIYCCTLPNLGKNKYVSVKNCLFIKNEQSGISLGRYGDDSLTSELDVIGCTFDHNRRGIEDFSLYAPQSLHNMVIEDNIFSNQSEASIESADWINYEPCMQAVVRNNIFWHNAADAPFIDYSKGNNKTNVNPLFTYRAPYNNRTLYTETGAYDDFLFDGYYLTQRPGDVAYEPFLVAGGRRITNINTQNVSCDNASNATIKVKAGGTLLGSIYCDGSSWSPTLNGPAAAQGPLKLEIENGNTGSYDEFGDYIPGPDIGFGDHDTIILTFDDGTTFTSLLALYGVPEQSCLPMYVVADGSTFPGSSSRCAPIGDPNLWDEDMDYALRYSPWGPEQKGSVAGIGMKSPAVDAGSRDFLSCGATCTNLASDNFVISGPGGQVSLQIDPENAYYTSSTGDYTSLQLDTWKNRTSSRNMLLDVGYHYLGSVQAPRTNRINPILSYPYDTLRYPKERLKEYTSNGRTYYPSLTNLAIAAGKFENNTPDAQTLVIFSADNQLTDYNQEEVHVQEFRSDETRQYTPILTVKPSGAADDLKYFPDLPNPNDSLRNWYVRAIAVKAVKQNGAHQLYVAIASVYQLGEDSSFGDTFLRVYRYNPASRNWDCLYNDRKDYYQESNGTSHHYGIHDVALTV